MIRIRSADKVSEPSLIAIDATLTTKDAVSSLACDEQPLNDSTSLAGGLFGSIEWPRFRFSIASDVILEQQMLLPHEGSAAALSWHLCGKIRTPVYLQIRPFFAGCGPRSYRDAGFRFQSPEEGGRLAWLPSVLGPTIIADTNGTYREDAFDRNLEQAGYLIAPGEFHFSLTNRPSILIFTDERTAATASGNLIGRFLAGLTPTDPRVSDTFLTPGTAAFPLAA